MSTWITKRANDLGLKVMDARAPLELELGRKHIDKATKKNAKCCAYAEACKEQFGVRNAYFLRSTAWLEYDGKLVRYILPQSMQKEIVSFDRSKIMAPGVYQLSKPTNSDHRGAVQKRNVKRMEAVKVERRKVARAAERKRRVARRPIRHRTKFIRGMQEPS